MKALVYQGPEALSYSDVATPAPVEGEALVHVQSVGICGSDMHAYLGHDSRRPAPLILGHEAAGVLDDGRRVTVNPLVACKACPACKEGRANLCPERQIISMPPREGAFAEALVMPLENLIDVPQEVPLQKAALAEPLAVCWHAAKLGLKACYSPPDRALVLGGGAIGMGSALALRALGVTQTVIVEPNPTRRSYLESQGEEVTEAQDGTWPLVIDAVGYAATRATATAAITPGGVVVHIGLGEDSGGLDVRRMTLQEITVIGTYAYTPADFVETTQAIFEGRLGALNWIEERPLKAGAAAFADLRAGRVAAPKILLTP